MPQKVYILNNKNKKVLLLEKVIIAKNFKDRLKGLMFKETLEPKTGLLLVNCKSIHMFFMKFSLDLIFLDKNMNILKITKNIKPGKIDLGIKNTKYVLELPCKSLEKENYTKITIEEK